MKFFRLCRKKRNKSDFESMDEILAINVNAIIFVIFHLKSIFELSYHVILCCAVVYNFILLGLYLILKFWEEKLFKSALVTKSLQLTIFFQEKFFILYEKDVKRETVRRMQEFFNSLFSLFVISAAFRADIPTLVIFLW